MWRTRILLPVLVAVLSGCTQERAEALKAGAEAFSAKAIAAIDSVVDLHLRALLGRVQEEEVLIRKAREELLETQRKRPGRFAASVPDAFIWLTERDDLRRQAFADYDKLKLAYAEFAAAYQRLPEGGLLAARDVSCSAALGARLVGYMASAGKALAANPVPLGYESDASTGTLAKVAAETLASRNEQPFDASVRAHVALLKDQQRANAQAVANLTDAVEAGAMTLEMIDRYDDVSSKDLLQGLRRILVLRESTAGLSSKAQIERLDNVVAKLNSKPALKQALSLPLGAKPAECN